MKQVTFKLPTIEQVDFTIECQPEYMSVRGNALASGNDQEDKECEDYIIDSLNNGNEWAWCCVKMTASYKGQEGTDYLGGCSYQNKEDFIKNSGYYEDMKQTAYNELISELESLQD